MSFINSDTLIAVDGNSLMHRAFYALPDMRASDGTPTGAIHGFFSMLLPLLAQHPGYVAVAFDMHGPTFRHEKYEEYKAGRRETPTELRSQFPLMQDILREMGIAVCETPRYEADDIIGTLSRKGMEQGIRTLIVTGDRDSFQLVNDSVHVLFTKKGITETDEYTPELLMERYGLTPDRMRDLKALMGDSSDHIPGIPGIGEKTALTLLSKYGSLEGVLQHKDEIAGKLGEKVRDNTELAELSYWLGTIDTKAPVDMNLSDCAFDPSAMSNGRQTLLKLGMRAVASKLPDSGGEEQKKEQVSTELTEISSKEQLNSEAEAGMESPVLALSFGKEISFSFRQDRTFVVRGGNTLFDEPLSETDVLKAFRRFLEDGTKKLIVFDCKKLFRDTASCSIKLNTAIHDVMIADYLLNSIKPATSFENVVNDFYGISSDLAGYMLPVYETQSEQMRRENLGSLYETIEFPLSRILAKMEEVGFRVDDKTLRELDEQFTARIDELRKRIYEEAGEEFNILSPKQLGVILFEKLKLPFAKKTKSGYSTDAETLDRIRSYHPVVPLILEYRNVTKLKSTYIDGLLNARNPSDGRVRSRFNQCLTATGRISSSEPNLQNIPVRTELGREIRKAFVASDGCVLVDADYSQIELRILAHLSGDARMIDAFRHGNDIHRQTASEVFEVPFDQVTDEMRRAAKAVNFGIVYGISDFGLSNNLEIPVSRARDYIRMYFERYPSVDAFMRECVRTGRENGYAVTMFGRRRLLPELKSNNYNTRSFGERVAMNMPIQGSAADIIKIAMIRVDEKLAESGLKSKLILQVHDELIVDALREEQEQVCALVKEAMENAAALSVPLTVEMKTGNSWYETK
ncbi:MAG: DNA polymerase I [Clostridia bacterium]|nr:DNA polymerase I [Clostridia bacterium]